MGLHINESQCCIIRFYANRLFVARVASHASCAPADEYRSRAGTRRSWWLWHHHTEPLTAKATSVCCEGRHSAPHGQGSAVCCEGKHRAPHGQGHRSVLRGQALGPSRPRPPPCIVRAGTEPLTAKATVVCYEGRHRAPHGRV